MTTVIVGGGSANQDEDAGANPESEGESGVHDKNPVAIGNHKHADGHQHTIAEGDVVDRLLH